MLTNKPLPIEGVTTLDSTIAPYDLEISRHEVRIDDLPPVFDGYRIVFLSDTHVIPSAREYFREVVAQTRALDCEVCRRDTQPTQIDAILAGGCAAGSIEAVYDVITEATGIVDDGVDAATDIDDVVSGPADDGVVVVATIERVVTGAAIEEIVAVSTIQCIETATAEQLVGSIVAVDDVVEFVAGAGAVGGIVIEVEILDTCAQHVADRGFYQVGAGRAGRSFVDDIARIIDK